MADIGANNLNFDFETEQEVDGRWIAEITHLPGVMTYGQTQEEAVAHATALALRVCSGSHG